MAGKKGMHDKHRFSEEYINRLRGKIKASNLIKALHDHALKGAEMTPSQVNAANVLLQKIMPTLQATELTDKRQTWGDMMANAQKKEREQGLTQSQPQEPGPHVTH